MKCYNCGSDLVNLESCPICGADVRMYKKAVALSNVCYNDGLSRAKLRDLSGAIDSLKKSLKFNKENTDARNLLGLIYFEIGEVVDALSEWVISKNLQSYQNIADEYLRSIQHNSSRLESINQTIKKYNQALLYCKQNNDDLAIIQLKKVLSLNSNLIKGYQLLSLIYIEQKSYAKADKILHKALKINNTDTLTLKYLEEVSPYIKKSEKNVSQTNQNEIEQVKKDKNKVVYRTGNDTIIQPTKVKEHTGLSTVLNIMIGVVVGILVTWFLVVPAIKQSAKSDEKNSLIEVNEQLADKESEINSLNDELESIKNKNKDLEKNVSQKDKMSETYTNLIKAYTLKQNEDTEGAATALEAVNSKLLSDDAKTDYEALLSEVNDIVLEEYYTEAYGDYSSGSYTNAAQVFTKIVDLDETYQDGNALYYLGECYRYLENNEEAKKAYERVMELFPESTLYYRSKTYVDQINEETVNDNTTGDDTAGDTTQ